MTDQHHWRNWSGTVHCSPTETIRPHSRDAIVAAVERAAEQGRTIRPRGSGHSGVPLAATADLALDLSDWTGIEAVDTDLRLVTVRSGTVLRALNDELHQLNLALPNLGDIDVQTVAGAMATATHGTGLRLGGMPTQIQAMEMVLADGSVVTCSATRRPELFAAARANLGALGVVSTITLRCGPAFALTTHEHPEPVERVLAQLDSYYTENTHFEFYWFPHGRNALVKCANRLPYDESPTPLHPVRHWFEYDVLENTALDMICRTGRAFPRLGPALNQLCSNMLSTRSYSDRSYRVLTTRRTVRFVECEYGIPIAALGEVFEQLRTAATQLPYPILIPVEVRFAAADDVWLSPAYRRPTAYISVQQYVGMPYREYFDRFESIADAVGGRPHLGKMHTLEHTALRTRYPRLDAFNQVRADVDPAGLFRTTYLDKVLGPIEARTAHG
ncbi:D-arabinono-1,4-lactone oxidase [Nocardia sp. NPDC050793]|uniref:D-arabinono-1,4-lactone oxidase n=1 Tax=Nocardia sp. NPDC050793 TaxID=3155159 RepID=UPI0033FDB664